jgi:hypothetical protein
MQHFNGQKKRKRRRKEEDDDLGRVLYLFGFWTKAVYAFITSPKRAVCSPHPII